MADEKTVQHVARAIADVDGDPTVMAHHIRRAEAAIKAVREMDAQAAEELAMRYLQGRRGG